MDQQYHPTSIQIYELYLVLAKSQVVHSLRLRILTENGVPGFRQRISPVPVQPIQQKNKL